MKSAFTGQTDVIFDHKSQKAPIILRDKLVSGNTIAGPAILVEYSSTIVVPPFAEASVDSFGNIVLKTAFNVYEN